MAESSSSSSSSSSSKGKATAPLVPATVVLDDAPSARPGQGQPPTYGQNDIPMQPLLNNNVPPPMYQQSPPAPAAGGEGGAQGEEEKTAANGQEWRFTKEALWGFGEIALYFTFIIFFCFAAYGTRDDTFSFYFNDLSKSLVVNQEFPPVVTQIEKTFQSIGQINDFWAWAMYPFNDAIASDPPSPIIYFQSVLLGRVRFRQYRIRSDGCEIPGPMQPLFKQVGLGCSPAYTPKYLSKAPIANITALCIGIPDPVPGVSCATYYASAYLFQTSAQLDAQPVLGRVWTYSGGGFGWDLTTNHTQNFADLNFLSNSWIDAQTRMVVVNFAWYNANVNMFFAGECVCEFLPTGGIVPSYTFRVMRLYRYTGRPVQIFLEIVVLGFVIFYTIQELVQIVTEPMVYFASGWNYMDLTNLALFYVLFIMRAVIAREFAKYKVSTAADPPFFNFSRLVTLTSTEYNIVSFNGFLLFFKVLKYSKFSKQALVITKTIKRAIVAIAAFIAMVACVVLGYGFFANQSFGIDVEDFKSFPFSIISIIRGLLGGLDFDALYQTNRLMGPIFFLSFVVLFIFILLNMFLAIINNAHEEVQEKYKDRETREQQMFRGLRDYAVSKLPARLVEWRAAARRKKAAEKAQSMVLTLDTNDDQRIDRQEAAAMFEGDESNLQELLGLNSVDALMRAYDRDNDGTLDAGEQRDLLRVIEEEKRKAAQVMTNIEAESGMEHRAYAAASGAVESSSGELPGPAIGRSGPGAGVRLGPMSALGLGAREPATTIAALSERVDETEAATLALHRKVDVVLEFLATISVGIARQQRRDSMRRDSNTPARRDSNTPAVRPAGQRTSVGGAAGAAGGAAGGSAGGGGAGAAAGAAGGAAGTGRPKSNLGR